MKVAHICLSCFYIDGFTYQENELVREHVNSKNEVLVIASTENYVNSKLTYVEPAEYIGADGARVIRVPYASVFPLKLAAKLRVHTGIYRILTEFKPDVIMFHGLCGWELKTVCRYVENNPQVKLWVDSHEDHNNSARTLGSKILHKCYYKPIIQSCLKRIDKVLCISLDTMNFVSDMYGIRRQNLEFFPLGAHVYDDDTYYSMRDAARKELSFTDEHIVFIQSGKQTGRKKLIESLLAFISVKNENFRFIIVGSISEEIYDEVNALILKDERVKYLGWKSSDDLNRYLCGSDVYLQPGTQSATMQMSIGARCILILDDVLSHEPFIADNGWLINDNNSLSKILNEIPQCLERRKDMAWNSYLLANKMLCYKRLANLLLTSSDLSGL
ncbi:MAG: glycosyl transferase family 1 [Bacteroidetes bacterium]|nr:glycosyl transferase family 1 [Bacteroidota bacterium]